MQATEGSSTIHIKNPNAKHWGVGFFMRFTLRKRQRWNTQPAIRPTEYRCYIQEDIQYATAGAATTSWIIPSSSGQAPRPGGT